MYQTQKQLILEYLEEHDSILPAKIGGTVYKGVMFGSETSKRCRELRKSGKLWSLPDGKFERFYDWPASIVNHREGKIIHPNPQPKFQPMQPLFPTDQLNIRA